MQNCWTFFCCLPSFYRQRSLFSRTRRVFLSICSQPFEVFEQVMNVSASWTWLVMVRHDDFIGHERFIVMTPWVMNSLKKAVSGVKVTLIRNLKILTINTSLFCVSSVTNWSICWLTFLLSPLTFNATWPTLKCNIQLCLYVKDGCCFPCLFAFHVAIAFVAYLTN